MNFRHEWKHEITAYDRYMLRLRLGAVCRPDSHAKDGKYTIRSLYFDDASDTALREKLDGVSVREKFRLRCYGGDTSLIHLEKKSKFSALGTKSTAAVTREEVSALLKGDLTWMMDAERPLVCELYTKMVTQGLRPKTIVDYTREPFIYDPGNVRVTMDYNIRTGLGGTDFLSMDCITVPVPDDPIILEVKWDGFLPGIIRDAVQLTGRHTGAYSKYAACRAYD